MKFSEKWLRKWVNPKLTRQALCEKLTMSGLEVEELLPVASEFSGVVVGEVLQVNKHPEADRLTLCDVSIGGPAVLKIVCGAANVAQGIRVPVAIIGAKLPGDLTIKPAKIRGAASQGMLCSAKELGLSEESDGLYILPADASLGMDLRKYLELDDYMIDLSITPNRGDCLSIKGLAREVSTLTNSRVSTPDIKPIKAKIKDKLSVSIKTEAGCPRYVGRIIRGVNAQIASPIWLRERLRRSGLRSISAIVDITNYVMLELGQPMHAFDLDKVDKEIRVRNSKQGEKLLLLDGSEQTLDSDTMLIADSKKPLAIAGVMGGLESGVTTLTQNIFLESAYFAPKTIAQSRQKYQLNSDSAYRFERGIDPDTQREAIERATQLVLEIAGGEAGTVIEVASKKHLPKVRHIELAKDKIERVLGIAIPDKNVASIFKALGFTCKSKKSGWAVSVPSFRSDIALAEDLIEELARVYGYDKIPVTNLHGELLAAEAHDGGEMQQGLRQILCDLGYHEVITYSFVDKKLQQLLDPANTAKTLLNPITADMDVMRTNLWPGLLTALNYNTSRQQNLVRLFEFGACFVGDGKKLTQPVMMAGLLSGPAAPEQWGVPSRTVDFFDMKGDLNHLLNRFGFKSGVEFAPAEHPVLHPGQSASISLFGKKIGIIGKLHPSLRQKLNLSGDIYLFELSVASLVLPATSMLREISKFPEIRRDIAIIVRDTVPAAAIQGTIIECAGSWLKDVFVFDVYQGKGITPGCKSVALGIVLQDSARTLVDEEVADLMQRVVTALKGQFGAELRS